MLFSCWWQLFLLCSLGAAVSGHSSQSSQTDDVWPSVSGVSQLSTHTLLHDSHSHWSVNAYMYWHTSIVTTFSTCTLFLHKANFSAYMYDVVAGVGGVCGYIKAFRHCPIPTSKEKMLRVLMNISRIKSVYMWMYYEPNIFAISFLSCSRSLCCIVHVVPWQHDLSPSLCWAEEPEGARQ